jgi:hypothetical protein
VERGVRTVRRRADILAVAFGRRDGFCLYWTRGASRADRFVRSRGGVVHSGRFMLRTACVVASYRTTTISVSVMVILSRADILALVSVVWER